MNDVIPRLTESAWTPVGTFPGARRAHASVVFNNRMWILGGNDSAGFRNDVLSSANGGAWDVAYRLGAVVAAGRAQRRGLQRRDLGHGRHRRRHDQPQRCLGLVRRRVVGTPGRRAMEAQAGPRLPGFRRQVVGARRHDRQRHDRRLVLHGIGPRGGLSPAGQSRYFPPKARVAVREGVRSRRRRGPAGVGLNSLGTLSCRLTAGSGSVRGRGTAAIVPRTASARGGVP